MKNTISPLSAYLKKPGVIISLPVTGISILMFIIALFGIHFKNDSLETLCIFSLIIELFYGVIVSFKLLKNKQTYLHLIPFLFLNWFIGCFCTNVLINIFENLPIWVYIVTFTFCATNFFIYANSLTQKGSTLFYFINGSCFLLIIYFMLYLIPIMPISGIGILALGLGFYGLVPIIVFFIHIATLYPLFSKNRSKLFAFLFGVSVVLIAVVIFGMKLNSESKNLSQYSVTKSFENNEDIPAFISISQHIAPNIFNEIVLKKGLVYTGPENFFSFNGLGSFDREQYNERKTHDPFINAAYLFSKELDLTEDDRINILKSNFDKRLETEEHLWSGVDLVTKNIKEDVKIYPNNRIAYTEITMDIACENKTWNDEEAIYSFQLPEGSVATSLSLWVHGIERKGILTTKDKALKAYKQIVGVEYRDPSLMQWKEGNRVVVRVFPINFDTPRTFKCGFTTPLKVDHETMKYQSLKITGPNISGASTLSRLQTEGKEVCKTSKDFTLDGKYYINQSTGLDDWNATIKLPHNTLNNSFTWKDKQYTIKPIEKIAAPYIPSEIILDLNSSWTLEEIKPFLEQKTLAYYIYLNNEKQKITLQNYNVLFPEFKELHYSLLPLYDLKENSLVVTKCGTFSANFEELSNSGYLNKLKSRTQAKQLRVMNLSKDINPFWQTIKEQKYVSYLQTDAKTALKLIREHQFLTLKTANTIVNIEPADMAISESTKQSNSLPQGSSHLFRLYAFGKVLEEQVKIQQDSLAHNQYVSLAEEANVVTPISSLIVLETDADYKKNGIDKNINTIGNASINDKPASPLPYPTVLIMIAFLLGLSYYKKTA